MNEKKCNICQKYIANEGGPMFCMLKQTPSDTCGYKRISDSKPEATPTPPDDAGIREAFEKEPMFQPWLKHVRYTELGFYKPLKESKYTEAVSSKLNDSLDGFEIGFKAGAASRDEEIEDVLGKIDDVLLQENQSLKEQIKILANMLYSYDYDFNVGDYLHSLSTEDFQSFKENNVKEIEEMKSELAALKSFMREVEDITIGPLSDIIKKCNNWKSKC